MPSLCALVTIDLNDLSFLHTGRPECGAVVNLRGVALVSSLIDAALDILADGQLDAVLGPCKACADVTGFTEACAHVELESHERVDLTLYKRLSYHFGFRRQLALFVVWTFS